MSVSSVFTRLYKDYETVKVGVSYSSLISGMLAEYFVTSTNKPSVATNGYNIVLSGIKTGSFFFIPINVPPMSYMQSEESVEISSFDPDLKNQGIPIAILSNSRTMRFVPALIFPLYLNEEEIIDGVVINAGSFFTHGEGTITISLDGKLYSKVTPLSDDNSISRNFLSLDIVSPFIDKDIHTKKDKGVLYTKVTSKSKKKRSKDKIRSLKQEILFLRQKSL